MKRSQILALKVCCLLVAVGMPLVMVIGALFPWKVADESLLQHRDAPRLLVGMNYARSGSAEWVSHSYIIVPYSLYTLDAIKVSKHPDGVDVRAEPFGAFLRLIIFAASIVGLWLIYRRQLAKPKGDASAFQETHRK